MKSKERDPSGREREKLLYVVRRSVKLEGLCEVMVSTKLDDLCEVMVFMK